MEVDSDNDLLSKTAAGELPESYVAHHLHPAEWQPEWQQLIVPFANRAFFLFYREAWPALRDEILSRLDKVRFLFGGLRDHATLSN
jgi:hypothetical protein